jgi:hypothetical protein
MSEEVETYLKSGNHDPKFEAWPGSGFFDRSQNGSKALREALVAEVLARTQHRAVTALPDDLDLLQFTRQKFSGMVKGLFPKTEQEIVLSMLERSVIFLTPRNIAQVLREMPWLGTAWDLANLYLASHSAELLSDGGSTDPWIEHRNDLLRLDRLFPLSESLRRFRSCMKPLIFFTTANARRWGYPIHGIGNGCSRSSIGSAKLSPMPVRHTAACSNLGVIQSIVKTC